MDQAGDDEPSLTRHFVTAQGDVDYARLSDLIAPHLRALLDTINDGGFTVRALLRELLIRLDFPPLDVAVERDAPAFSTYRAALADFDNGRIELLINFWVQRLEL